MSWSLRNLGRRFLTCYKPEDCKFFEWYDNDFTGRTKDVVVHLNNRRIVLEEKLSLVEERLAMEVEKKLAVEAHNKKLGRTVKFFSYVMVVLTLTDLFLTRNLYLAKAWFHSSQPMTRSHSSELRKRYVASQNSQTAFGIEASII
ncbi:hypothetical protein POM88_040211 [Heracleum sosnowskyi]|uniref:Uncharacterized protein n=1 Tax=Heracleum sosnowskyi TaxID=360622 RepID=A0AAD8M762_9APIA|nr:hypothetical protein POM88_040211 [Heracleum sosnowskyi]